MAAEKQTFTDLTSDTYLIFFTDSKQDVFSSVQFARKGQTTEIVAAAGTVREFTDYNSFNTALASYGQPRLTFDPFTQGAPESEPE